jgi:hypothetical protein
LQKQHQNIGSNFWGALCSALFGIVFFGRLSQYLVKIKKANYQKDIPDFGYQKTNHFSQGAAFQENLVIQNNIVISEVF